MATLLELCRQSRWRRLAFLLGATAKLAPYMVTPVHAQQSQRVNVAQIAGQTAVNMPYICDNSTGVQSTVISIISTQTQVVSSANAGATKSIFVCGFSVTQPPGSTNSWKWVEGTSTDCISGQADKSGLYYASSAYWGMVSNGGGAVLFHTSSGQSLCIDATSSGLSGQLTFIAST